MLTEQQIKSLGEHGKAQDQRIAELEARLRPGVSDMLNRLMVANLAHVSPTTGEISFTEEGEAVIKSRTRRASAQI
jgi:Mn-dependent DtxR family transcriptional regulator